MLFTFLKKQKEKKIKTEALKALVQSLDIPESQKELFLGSLDILETNQLEALYSEITIFIEKFEIKQIDEISKDSFSTVAGMTTSQANEKKKEINAFSFLIHNI